MCVCLLSCGSWLSFFFFFCTVTGGTRNHKECLHTAQRRGGEGGGAGGGGKRTDNSILLLRKCTLQASFSHFTTGGLFSVSALLVVVKAVAEVGKSSDVQHHLAGFILLDYST